MKFILFSLLVALPLGSAVYALLNGQLITFGGFPVGAQSPASIPLLLRSQVVHAKVGYGGFRWSITRMSGAHAL